MGPKQPKRRNHIDEEEYQEAQEDFFNILDEERRHWEAVERIQERLEESKSWVMTSITEKEAGWVSSEARLVQNEEKLMRKNKFHNRAEWSVERFKDKFARFRRRRGLGTDEWKAFEMKLQFDGSFKGVSGKDAACGWAVLQLDNDKEEEPWYAIHGTMLAELEVQRTMKRAELCAFTMLPGRVGPSTIPSDSMSILDGLWRGEEGCIGPTQKDADLWIQNLGLITRLRGKHWDLDVKRVKAHWTEKEWKAMVFEEHLV